MSDSAKAVFLSYASQDAAAAKRIADALRAAGVEVWFDQNELVGGDAWDAKIRGQISSCALFVPIISANTQARLEGYFRIEWKLAARRTYAIASAKAFLLPIVIDDTRDAVAHVPDEFREVQWTRLPGGEPTPKFCAHVQRLLGGPAAEQPGDAPRASASPSAAPAGRASSRLGWMLGAGALTAVLVTAGALYWSRRELASPVPATPATANVAPQTEAQRLATQAQQILESSDEINRENLFLAEELVKRALALEPANVDALLVSTRLSQAFVWFLIDSSRARRELLMQHANRAVALAPQSVAARLARVNAQTAIQFSYSSGLPGTELENEARALVKLEPGNWRTHLALGEVLRSLTRPDESIAAIRRAYELSNGNASAASALINVLFRAGRFQEANEVRARALSLGSGRLLCWDVMIKLRWLGDADAAREATRTWPGWLAQEDRGLHHRWLASYWARRPDEAQRIARLAVRDMVRDFSFYGPAAALRALANEQAGDQEAAQSEWRATLERAELELRAEPTNEPGLYWKAWALARLGRVAEAKPIVAELAQRNRQDLSAFIKASFLEPLQLVVGEKDAALAGLRRRLNAQSDSLGVTRALLELDPAYDSVRNDPEFQAILRDAPAPAKSDAAAAPKADEKSVAVLAFANLSDDRANEAFSDGISEELLNVLAKVPGLKVTARTSAFHFKGKDTPIPDIARTLGVAYVVEGSVRRSGDKVRITAQLIKAADGFRVWSDTFTRDLKDVFAVQDEIAGLIAQNLSLKIGGAPAATTAALDAEVLPLYYAALQAWNLRTVAGMDRAEELLNRALALAPNFARGHAVLAKVWVIRGELTDTLSPFGARDSALARKVRAKVDQAMQLDPACAEAYGALGVLNWDTWRTEEAAAALRRATELNPNYASAHQWLGRVRSSQGYLDEGIASLRRAVEVDPLSQRILDNCGRLLLFAGRPEEALQFAERALAIQPDALQAQALKAQALVLLGRNAEALQIALPLPSDRSIVSVQKVQVLVRVGRLDEVERLLPELTGGNILAKLGALAALGRKQEALAALDSDWFSANRVDVLLFEPLLDPLRSEPQFQRMLERLALTEAHARAQAWRAAHLDAKGKRK